MFLLVFLHILPLKVRVWTTIQYNIHCKSTIHDLKINSSILILITNKTTKSQLKMFISVIKKYKVRKLFMIILLNQTILLSTISPIEEI